MMMKKMLMASLIGTVLFFVGCGDNEGESRLETQQMLDSGDYAGVIAKLEGVATNDDEYLALASAYMGNAGLGFADLVSLMADSTDTGEDGFASFAKSLTDETSDTALIDLSSAVDNYKKVVGDETCDDQNQASLTDSQKDICLFIGLSSTLKAATTLSYLGDLTNFGATDGTTDYELKASACAMQYAYSGDIGDGCSVKVADDNITFASQKTYTELNVTVTDTNETFEYLMTTDQTINQTIVTDGYCDINFTACDKDSTDDCYVCPVNQDVNSTELTVANILVEVLNDGIDSVVATLGVDSDIAEDVEAYKEDVQNSDGEITIESIINYINTQN